MLRPLLCLFILSGPALAPAAQAASTLPSAPVTPATVTVRSGDTLFKIAVRHGLSVAQLRALNGLRGDLVQVGQVLRLRAPGATGSVVAGSKVSGSKVSGGQGVYTVRRGDFLSKIGARYGVSASAIQAANGLRGTVITPGQRLKIPARGAAVGAAPRPTSEVRLVYRYVRLGTRDTPGALAARHRLSVDQLRRINGLGSRKYIVPGMKLLVPARIPVPIPPPPVRPAVTFKRLTPIGVPVQIVNVDLRHRDVLVSPVLAGGSFSYRQGARVGQLARQSGARALINGSYFHPRSFAPAGDIVMQGRMLTWGRIPTALAITPDNRATIRASTTPLFQRPLDTSWAGMETVIASGPRILSGGQLHTRYNAAFRDPALFGRAARSAVGLIGNRDLVLVSTHARLTTTEMGKVMARLGVRDALLLDGGSSAGIAWNGLAVLDSARKVSYGIGVFTDYVGRRYLR